MTSNIEYTQMARAPTNPLLSLSLDCLMAVLPIWKATSIACTTHTMCISMHRTLWSASGQIYKSVCSTISEIASTLKSMIRANTCTTANRPVAKWRIRYHTISAIPKRSHSRWSTRIPSMMWPNGVIWMWNSCCKYIATTIRWLRSRSRLKRAQINSVRSNSLTKTAFLSCTSRIIETNCRQTINCRRRNQLRST